MTRMPERAVRIGNMSGFFGDRDRAALEMVQGGPLDVLTGDYLAELTMLILWKTKRKDPAGGYARTVLNHVERVLGETLDKGIKIVNNAGGLNPAGLAEQIAAIGERLGLHPKIAYVTGDDLLPQLDDLLAAGHTLPNLDTGKSLAEIDAQLATANAYLGGWGIAAALEAGADIVITPRVTDASLVVGPAAWWHSWQRGDFDALAGAVVAGHVIECGPQATGGNYSFFNEVTDRRYPGFPIAEVAVDGSSVITKHPDTGGLVSVGTVSAQLLYEIGGPEYLNPDVIAHFDSIRLEQLDTDRVQIFGTKGSAPTGFSKVAINFDGGYRNTMTLVLTGLNIEEKAAWAESELFEVLGGKEQFADVDVRLLRFDHADARTNPEATAHLRITVKDPDPKKVGRRFSNATQELALGGYPGFHATTPPSSESSYGVYWPALVPSEVVHHAVVLPDGTSQAIPHTPAGERSFASPSFTSTPLADEPTSHVPLGTIVGARSGDKGGNANIGLWAKTPGAFAWLEAFLTVERLRILLPEAANLDVQRYLLPELNAMNFVVVGILGEGVASSTRPDPQAKGLGEFVRSRCVEIPTRLL
ncbi:MAG TPA: acyclic terpene utilization AtuA family protein [Jatrophihabitans sp.]|jgi:hypothetical protein